MPGLVHRGAVRRGLAGAGLILLAGVLSLPPARAIAAEEEHGRGGAPAGHSAPPGHPGGGPAAHPGGPVGRPGGPPGRAGEPGHAGERYTFNGRDARHFTGRDFTLWRGGRWVHEMHDGRFGWWWFAGGAWYFYDQPIYPYPPYVSDYVYGYPVVPFEPPPAAVPPMNLPPPTATRYYCSAPAGYYPQVQSCPGGFQAVVQ